MGGVDISRVMVLREILASSGWVERTQGFARTMRRRTTEPGGLLLVGTPEAEPWHLAAHLDDESRLAGTPQLSPTLVRYQVPQNAPSHLSVTLARLEVARKGETVFVVSEDAAPEMLLERAWDARKLGATVLSLDAGDDELHGVAHESLVVPAATESTLLVPELDVVSFDSVQHLVSVAAGEAAQSPSSTSVRERMAKLLEHIAGPRIS
ncbi:MAG: hypothetical protein LH630_02220 [Actinomycetia bacterium]|nr:hypothetical protein [Actinomycetes bacterium]